MRYLLLAALFFIALAAQARAQNIPQPELVAATKFAKAGKLGSLGTISRNDPAMPSISSATAFLWNQHVVLYLNENSEHSHDLAQNPKGSFMFSGLTEGYKGDINDQPRITFSGTFHKVGPNDKDYAAIKKSCFAKYPEAARYDGSAAFHDFYFYVMDVTRIRVIMGFGRIYNNLNIAEFWKQFEASPQANSADPRQGIFSLQKAPATGPGAKVTKCTRLPRSTNEKVRIYLEARSFEGV